MEKIDVKNSVLNFRKAQIICADSESTIEELRLAESLLEEALELKKKEEIFTHNDNFLKMFNLQNHSTVFHDLL